MFTLLLFWLFKMPMLALAVIFTITASVRQLSGLFHTSFYPFCALDMLAKTSFCRFIDRLPSYSPYSDLHPAYHYLLSNQTEEFVQLLNGSETASALALDLMETRLASSDLVTIVRLTSLDHEHGEKLAALIQGFSDVAGDASQELEQLASCLITGVDSIIASLRYVLRLVVSSTGWQPVMCQTVNALSPITLCPYRLTPQAQIDLAVQHALNVTEDVLHSLILKGQLPLAKLNLLESQLWSIGAIVLEGNLMTAKAEDELLSHLWTWFGGNRRLLERFRDHAKALRRVGAYREKALRYVLFTLNALTRVEKDISGLRSLAVAGLLEPPTSIEVLIELIIAGAERLRVGQFEARAAMGRRAESFVREINEKALKF
ncbi:hypothetical protein BD410DRAFT_899798 [Rickenella mellea]|uniref:Uncharacterized protein n=1 Tax=Rickenella mellea TaxID=50990 RepID=A0A4Y7PYM1_9AGAM|nr:hypothetical protein BD410DRAFT_899798 [Rickenella mellea]